MVCSAVPDVVIGDTDPPGIRIPPQKNAVVRMFYGRAVVPLALEGSRPAGRRRSSLRAGVGSSGGVVSPFD